ncbi:PREDICTED: glutaredoxin 2 isoform X3 [Ficedula albicollis]|uniref:Glutaredoxin-2, mitochondrial n=1 Tax=Ficedula albicollis TaxID=59894 RepID=U3JJS7_FICAL|nr:PREDICTED: glutaredoxin 2 isoform X3 [Ficedula albicollis]
MVWVFLAEELQGRKEASGRTGNKNGDGEDLNSRMGNIQTTSAGLSNDAAVNQIQDIISHNPVVIFSKTTCPYCKMAKDLFEGLDVNYTAVELDVKTNGRQFQDVLEQMTGGRTVPRVFINGTCVGGATDTQKLHEEGKLLPLIHQCQMKANY